MLRKAFEHYAEEILPYTWIFTYDDGTKNVLKFEEHHLMHLLGLHKITRYVNMKRYGRHNIPKVCYNDLKQDTPKVTYEEIKKDTNRQHVEPRILHFPKLKDILLNPATQHFQFDRKLANSEIRANVVLYQVSEDNLLHFHFFKTYETPPTKETPCAPVTWIPRFSKPEDKFITGQVPLKVTKVERIPNNPPPIEEKIEAV